MTYLELHFPILGTTLPTQYQYPLYAALSHLVPSLHAKDSPVRIGPIRGMPTGQGTMQLPDGRSLLKLRLPDDHLRIALPLAGKALEVAGHRVRLGVPQVLSLIPATTLIARLVLIKPNQLKAEKNKPLVPPTPEQFLDRVKKKLTEMEIQAIPSLPHNPAGTPRRGILRIHSKSIVGYSVRVEGLTAEESIKLQEEGLGGRLRLGCGFFVPVKESK